MNIVGGTHHAFTNRGEGFCMLNDQAIGARYLLEHNLASKILIVDLDVHQGNGTAEIFQDEPNVFTFSMHGRTNYPFIKEESDLDIPLENETEDEEYLSILKETLPKLILEQEPDFIYYLCGVDVIASDKLGKLSLTIEGCKERDRYVLQKLQKFRNPCDVQHGWWLLRRHQDNCRSTCQYFSHGAACFLLILYLVGKKHENLYFLPLL